MTVAVPVTQQALWLDDDEFSDETWEEYIDRLRREAAANGGQAPAKAGRS